MHFGYYVLTFTGAFGFMDLGLGVAVGRYIGLSLGKGDQSAVRDTGERATQSLVPILGLMAGAFSIVGAVGGPDGSTCHLRTSAFCSGRSLQAELPFSLLITAIVADSVTGTLGFPICRHCANGNQCCAGWSSRAPGVGDAGPLSVNRLVGHHGCVATFRPNMACPSFVPDYFRFRFRTMDAPKGNGSLHREDICDAVRQFVLRCDRSLILGKIAPAAEFAHYTIAANAGNRVQALSQATMGPIFNQTNRVLSAGLPGVAAIYNEAFGFHVSRLYLDLCTSGRLAPRSSATLAGYRTRRSARPTLHTTGNRLQPDGASRNIQCSTWLSQSSWTRLDF
jgi:hypothetical protein